VLFGACGSGKRNNLLVSIQSFPGQIKKENIPRKTLLVSTKSEKNTPNIDVGLLGYNAVKTEAVCSSETLVPT
jgi:hypothetical protein